MEREKGAFRPPYEHSTRQCGCMCTLPQTLWVYGIVRPYIVSKSISRHLRVVIVKGSDLAMGCHKLYINNLDA